MSILGPERSASQVEVSFTDARALGIQVPVRESGDIEGSPSVKLVGPAGEVTIPCGVIAAKRHIHMTPADAEKLGLKDKDVVSVKTSGERSVVFNETVVRVSDKFLLRMHIDTDEANAAGIAGEVEGEIIPLTTKTKGAGAQTASRLSFGGLYSPFIDEARSGW